MYEKEWKENSMPTPNGSMSDLLRETSCVASDVLAMSRKINGHIFGSGSDSCAEKEEAPRCFYEELEKQRSTLMMAVETLSVICSRLGI